jgi:hypothetical protein
VILGNLGASSLGMLFFCFITTKKPVENGILQASGNEIVE